MPPFWLRPSPSFLATLLAPLGSLYAWAAGLHGAWRAKHAYYAGVPVISVGNLTLGGSGKTPLVAWLAEYLAPQGPLAIVSRGYGGRLKGPVKVDPALHGPADVGDEPWLLARQLSHLPVSVWVGKNRPAAVRRAEQAGASQIILDDGFQRRDVARNVDILVVDGAVGFGNRLPVPAGPLREGWQARKRADFAVVITSPGIAETPAEGPIPYYGLPAYRLQTAYAPSILAPLRGQRLLAFAGIGRPAKFYHALKACNLQLVAQKDYPDHHAYTHADLEELKALAKRHKAVLVTTPKDAVKLPAGFALVAPLFLEGPDTEDILTEIANRLR